MKWIEKKGKEKGYDEDQRGVTDWLTDWLLATMGLEANSDLGFDFEFWAFFFFQNLVESHRIT